MNFQVVSIGEALPGRDVAGMEVSNELLASTVAEYQAQHKLDFPLPEASFPLERVGVERRRFLDASLSAYDLGLAAARQAVERAGLPADAYRAVVMASVTPPWTVPPVAAIIASDLGFGNDLAAFDTAIGCNGYLGGLHLLQSMLAGCPEGSAGLLVTSEVMSRVLDATDRQTCVIFGDAAAATVVQRGKNGAGAGLGPVAWSTQGEKGFLITIEPGPGPTVRFAVRDGKLGMERDEHSSQRVKMQGRQVFRDMVTDLPRRIKLELERIGRSLEDFEWFAFHQANRRIVDAVADQLRIPPERILHNVDHLGNTTSASIPLMLSEAGQSGKLRQGHRVLLVGFGTGYSVGISELLWTGAFAGLAREEQAPLTAKGAAC